MNRGRRLATIVGLFAVAAGPWDARRSAGAPRSTTKPAATQPVGNIRQLDVTVLGPIRLMKGVVWKRNPRIRPELALSISVEEECNVTIHLPDGKMIRMRTRPILFISRLWLRDDDNDLVLTISAPPEAKDGSLTEKVREAEGLLASWGAVPNDHMRALLNELKTARDPGVGVESGVLPTVQRVGRATIGCHSEVLFEFWRNAAGKWSIVAVISAKQSEWERLVRNRGQRGRTGTKPTTRPDGER